MGVSEHNSTPKSSILIGFSIINHPFWDTTIYGNTHIYTNYIHPNCWKPRQPGWWGTGETCHGRSWDSTNSSCHLAPSNGATSPRVFESTLWVDSCTQNLATSLGVFWGQHTIFSGWFSHALLPFSSRILKSTCSWKRCKTILEKHRSKWCRTELGASGAWRLDVWERLQVVGGWLSKKYLKKRMGSCQMDPRFNSLSVTVIEAAYFKWT